MNPYHLYYKKLPNWHDPEQVFLALYAGKKYTFWLDNKDYSYMGTASKRIKYTISNNTISISNNNNPPTDGRKLHQNIFTYLQKKLSPITYPLSPIHYHLPFDFTGGFVGYFGYELGRDIQGATPRRDVPKVTSPDSYLFFVNKFIVFDHRQKCLYLACLSKNKNKAMNWLSTTNSRLSTPISHLSPVTCHLSPDKPLAFTLSRSRRQYLKDVLTCQKHLTAGDAYQICLTNQITANIKTNWLTLFRTLRATNPAPFSAYINFGNFALISSSPEQFFTLDKKRVVTSKPMKGTVQRGDSPEKDLRLAQYLGKTKKDYAENIMIVDLVRSDLGKVCEIGSIKVTKPLEVQTYTTVHQLVSTIKGKLRPGTTIIDLLEAAFPGGSMTGAPKIAACEIIAELEKAPRGIYSGAFGFLSLNGTANLAMTIRTIIATKNQLSFGTGGAILADSIPQEEYNEMLLKAQPLMVAIAKTTGAKTFRLSS